MDFFASRPLTPHNLGLQRGIGAFEYFRTYEKKPFLLQKRYERLVASSKLLNIPFSYSYDEVEKIVDNLLPDEDCAVRLLLTAEEEGSAFFVIPGPLPKKVLPVRLKTFSFARFLPHIKSTNYLGAHVIGQQLEGFDDALYCQEGQILEARHANFFAVKGGRLITPKEGILPGITRGLILEELAREIPVEERAILVEEISAFDEVFITGSIREIVPVLAIDKQSYQVGEITKILTHRWENLTAPISV